MYRYATAVYRLLRSNDLSLDSVTLNACSFTVQDESVSVDPFSILANLKPRASEMLFTCS